MGDDLGGPLGLPDDAGVPREPGRPGPHGADGVPREDRLGAPVRMSEGPDDRIGRIECLKLLQLALEDEPPVAPEERMP